jgi:bacteriorhodopsin
LLFGIFGLFFHFKRDPKYAFTFFATFLVTGILLALFQNQQDPQPREREYFYVGSFVVWAL